ncbi:hypothetical protein CERZMDRAFT_88067 [Cercospora zeae-maydis SCOH1-5]|uniref:Uncharacterized protein n=1 Tax=Cercospora zeae-maydis SCOH1-5 TaxID=717836 RepID=A0A6A6F5W8_9PEZI|nr:hypothetical protein CERZMDRAFT_88067 [Cercospora zeae-maydis SCOH1-5]
MPAKHWLPFFCWLLLLILHPCVPPAFRDYPDPTTRGQATVNAIRRNGHDLEVKTKAAREVCAFFPAGLRRLPGIQTKATSNHTLELRAHTARCREISIHSDRQSREALQGCLVLSSERVVSLAALPRWEQSRETSENERGKAISGEEAATTIDDAAAERSPRSRVGG